MMFLTFLKIEREGYYGGHGTAYANRPLRATIQLQGQNGKVELNLDPEMSKRIVEIVADEVAAAGRATAEAMTAEIITQSANLLPAE